MYCGLCNYGYIWIYCSHTTRILTTTVHPSQHSYSTIQDPASISITKWLAAVNIIYNVLFSCDINELYIFNLIFMFSVIYVQEQIKHGCVIQNYVSKVLKIVHYIIAYVYLCTGYEYACTFKTWCNYIVYLQTYVCHYVKCIIGLNMLQFFRAALSNFM